MSCILLCIVDIVVFISDPRKEVILSKHQTLPSI